MIMPLIVPSPDIPAWRRLGLKLKNQDDPQDNLVISTIPLPPSKTTESVTNLKRQRDQSELQSTPAKKAKNWTLSSSIPSEVQEAHTPSLKKRKSVTFTRETKAEDGDSVKQLFSAWVEQQKALDPSFGAKKSIEAFKIPEAAQVAEQVEDENLTEREKRVKRVKQPEKAKKEKGLKKQSISAASVESPCPLRLSPALAYLRQYHDSRDTWKFNKNHQKFIIKHAFDTTKIPWEYHEVLLHYISGIQGGVRTRLRDEALKFKVQDQEAGDLGFPASMSDRDKKQREYNAAMTEYVATVTMRDAHPAVGYEEGMAMNLSDSAMRERVGKRMRAERILAQLGRDPEQNQTTNAAENDSRKRMKLNDGSVQKPARKRKQRTAAAVGDDDTSSSSGSDESSSDDSSDSDSEDSSDSEESSAASQGTSQAAPRAETESSSSSSSNSSSSEDDSDDSSDVDGAED